jgi:hypothetical protein
MRYWMTVVVFSTLWIAGCSEKRKEPDFRNTNWGITGEQVKILETARLVLDNGKMLSYDGTVGGLPCQIVYIFVKNQLTNGHYFFKTAHAADSLHLRDYENLKQAISTKYGAPRVDDATWHDERYRGDARKVGLALRAGHMKLAAEWETPTTEVWLFLGGENSQIKLSMKYVSKLLGNMREDDVQEAGGDPKPNEF